MSGNAPNAPQYETPNPVSECLKKMPVVTRGAVLATVLGGMLGSLLGLWRAFGNCPQAIVGSYGLQLYRLLTAPVFAKTLLGAVFGALTMAQICPRIESTRGSMYMLYTLAWLVVVVEFGYLLLGALGGLLWPYETGHGWDSEHAALPDTPRGEDPEQYFHDKHNSPTAVYFKHQCEAGPWPFVFALMYIECAMSEMETRRVCCLPWDVPVRYYPAAVAALFVLLGGFSLSWPLGLAAGYVYAGYAGDAWAARCQPSQLRLQQMEQRLTGVAGQAGFVSLQAAGSGEAVAAWSAGPFQQGQGAAQPNPNRQRPVGDGTGSSSSVGGSSSGGPRIAGFQAPGSVAVPQSHPTTTGTASASVFAQSKGYTLGSGGGGHSAGSSASPSSSSSVSASSGPSQASRAAAAALAARLARQQAAGGSGSGSSTPGANPTIVDMTRVDVDDDADEATETTRMLGDRHVSSSSRGGGGGGGGGDSRGGHDAAGFERNVAALQALGYTRTDALNALTVSGGDLQGAADYLMS